jgi:putative membrane protein
MYAPDDSPETVHSSTNACSRGKGCAKDATEIDRPATNAAARTPAMQRPDDRSHLLATLFIATLIALVLSGWRPYDRVTWLMEVAPVLIALPLLVVTRHDYPLTTLLYLMIFVHSLVLILGGAYTYARVPPGFWVQEALGLARNPYDKLGHFMQGFVPALVAREILLRGGFVRGRRMLAFLCLCVALAISAVYELIEWWAALALGQGADEFLGTQGDPWDTQSDMFLAFIGASVALIGLSRVHDRQLEHVGTIRAVE